MHIRLAEAFVIGDCYLGMGSALAFHTPDAPHLQCQAKESRPALPALYFARNRCHQSLVWCILQTLAIGQLSPISRLIKFHTSGMGLYRIRDTPADITNASVCGSLPAENVM